LIALPPTTIKFLSAIEAASVSVTIKLPASPGVVDTVPPTATLTSAIASLPKYSISRSYSSPDSSEEIFVANSESTIATYLPSTVVSSSETFPASRLTDNLSLEELVTVAENLFPASTSSSLSASVKLITASSAAVGIVTTSPFSETTLL
jgi:hypothetical protein